MVKVLLSKLVWKNAIGASFKPKRLHLVVNEDRKYDCPVHSCDSNSFHSIRGCRKHVYNKHGWYFYFDTKPDIEAVFPERVILKNPLLREKRTSTTPMPSFSKNCQMAKNFQNWLQSPGGGGKSLNQSEQLSSKVLKYTKFCCEDVSPTWELPPTVIDYCIGSVSMMADFINQLQEKWNVGYSGTINYMNALSHFMDYRRSMGISPDKTPIFVAAEIYIERVKKCLSKKMRIEWNTVLSVEYLTNINCWASLDEMQEVIPFHAEKFTQIILNAGNRETQVQAHDLSFATSYVVANLFLLVKASRPMTFQHLTVTMISRIREDGIIDQTVFKTREKYGFDSLIFSKEVVDILNGYINCIRIRLNPICDYLLISRNGTQLRSLTEIFGRDCISGYRKVHPSNTLPSNCRN